MGVEELYAILKKYVDDSLVGVGALKGKNCKIKSIVHSDEEHKNTVTFLWTDDNNVDHESQMIVKDGTGGEGGGSLEADLTASVSVGGISAGRTFTTGTALESVLRAMLSPALYPTLTNPSATLSATGAKLLEIGDTLNTTMTVTFNRGSINPAYGTSGYRSGVATTYALNSGVPQENNTFEVLVTDATLAYRASVDYEAGEQPKDSTGADYDSSLPAGSINTNVINYEFVNALWANTANIESVAKLPLVSKSAKVCEFNFPAQTTVNPEIFDVPANWTVTAVEVLNTLSNQWEDCSAEFTVSDTNHDNAAGVSTAYKRYTDNRGYNASPRKVRVKWS